MNNTDQKIKKLAIIASQSDKIPSDIEEYILNYLGKQELKIFLKYFKSALEKKRVYVSSPADLRDESITMLKGIYKGKDILVDVNPSLGAGLKIRENDTIIDFTFRRYIDETIESLKD